MKKASRILSIILVLTLCFGLFPLPVSAASADRNTKAKALWNLGLFKGYDESGSNFGLSDRATREQALVFLIRLLGEDKAATAWTGATPYTDVPSNSWAKPYIGYAKEKGYTVGIGDNKFGLGRNAGMQEMTMFVLRGLGYSDASGVKDFTWANCVTFAKNKGILDSDEIITPFTRGVAVDILFGAIGANVKNKDYDLLSKLMNMGVVTQAQYDKAMNTASDKATSDVAEGTYTMKCMGKYFRVNSGKLEIRDTTPAQTFTVKNKSGYSHIQTEDGKYLSLASMTEGTQLTTSTSPFKWLIQTQSKGVYTIRPVSGTKMIVNANGQSSANGTKIIIWPHSNAPKNTLITFDAPVVEADITANFSIVNKTGNSIVDLYITDSSESKYDEDFLTKNNYKSFSNDKYIDAKFVFDKTTKFDFYIRYADGSEAEALGLSFAKATTAGGTVTLNPSNVVLASGSTTLSTATLTAKKGAVTPAAPAVTDKTVTIYNLTDTTWTGLYSSSTKVTEWGKNLSSGTVTNNSSLKVIFPVSADEYKFDLKATYSGGEYIFEGLNMSKVANNTTFYLYLDSGTPVISTTKPLVVRDITVDFKNLTGKTIAATYSSSSQLKEWGSDLTGTWMDNETKSIMFPVGKGDEVFDIKLVIDGEEYMIYGLDFSDVTSSTIKCQFLWEDDVPVLYQL